jgi:hypothetical protein
MQDLTGGTAMPIEQAAVRTGHAIYPPAGYFRRQGSLVLFPDKIAFAGSYASSLGGGGGLVGLLIGRGFANATASKKVAKGGKGVATVALADITRIAPALSKRGRVAGLIVSTSGEGDFRFTTAKGDDWISDLSRLLQDSGRQVTPVDGGHAVN